jgi:hypothetical protein
MTRKLLTHSLAVLVACAATTAGARADEVTDWNQTLFRSVVIAGTSPLNTTRVAAMLQAAVFDAVNGIDRRYSHIHVAPAAPAGASRRAAAVQAAYVILGKHYGTGGLLTQNQQPVLNARRDVALAVIGFDESSASIASGVAWGQQVADAIWAWRSTDGFNTAAPIFAGGPAIGQWRPTPNAPGAGVSSLGAGYPQFFAAPTWSGAASNAFDPGPPPALGSARYLADYNETDDGQSDQHVAFGRSDNRGAVLELEHGGLSLEQPCRVSDRRTESGQEGCLSSQPAEHAARERAATRNAQSVDGRRRDWVLDGQVHLYVLAADYGDSRRRWQSVDGAGFELGTAVCNASTSRVSVWTLVRQRRRSCRAGA